MPPLYRIFAPSLIPLNIASKSSKSHAIIWRYPAKVSVEVQFNHEEIQILRQRDLLNAKLADRRPANAKVDARDDKFELRVSDIVNGKRDVFLTENPSAAKIYEEQLLGTLHQLKLWIEDNAEMGSRTVIEF
ncbi:hypothetical protein QTO30_04735 [Yoonia sp. GPGPB17]|uniref:hypothetical protein n=1 Tax=Yoonia sp. GPGPB17 TaxID=3026147 RepID=UPI0030C5BD22